MPMFLCSKIILVDRPNPHDMWLVSAGHCPARPLGRTRHIADRFPLEQRTSEPGTDKSPPITITSISAVLWNPTRFERLVRG